MTKAAVAAAGVAVPRNDIVSPPLAATTCLWASLAAVDNIGTGLGERNNHGSVVGLIVGALVGSRLGLSDGKEETLVCIGNTVGCRLGSNLASTFSLSSEKSTWPWSKS